MFSEGVDELSAHGAKENDSVTYSIVARDSATGAFGVAIQSYAPWAGAIAPAALAGVGALTTQAWPDVQHKPRALAMLSEGRSADEVVTALAEGDPHVELRQFAVVDREGRVAARTGSECMAAAGHLIGDGYSVQANMMRGPEVWPAMAQTFEAQRSGDFTHALLAALEAAEAAGGDVRGKQSAAILIVPSVGTAADRTVDLRVDSSPDPLGELARLVRMRDAFSLAEESEQTEDPAARADLMGRALELAPDWAEMRVWAALSLLEAGAKDRGLELLHEVIDADPGWHEFLRRLDPRQAPAAEEARRLLDS
jgi:uncharacterized Ntn-hydrolase superfamily protein